MVQLQSAYSNEVSGKLDKDIIAPGQVLNLTHTVEQGLVKLAWDAVTVDAESSPITDLKAYRIFRKEGVGEFALIGTTVDSSTVAYTDSTAKDGATYTYAVAAIDTSDNEGVKSTDLAVKTIPSVPTNLVATSSADNIRLDWKSVKDDLDVKLNENLTGYNVYRTETQGSDYEKIGTVDHATVTYTDSTALDAKTYYYVVTAYAE